MARQSISKKLRFDIFKRDRFLCRYCGRGVGADVILEIDHVLPVVEGGTNDAINLVTACFDCNRGKSKHLLTSAHPTMPDQRERAKLLKEQKAQVAAFLEYKEAQNDLGSHLARSAIEPIISSLADPERDIPRNWRDSVDFFLREKPFHEVHKAACIASDRFRFGDVSHPFLYFCGVMRKAIKNGHAVGEGFYG